MQPLAFSKVCCRKTSMKSKASIILEQVGRLIEPKEDFNALHSPNSQPDIASSCTMVRSTLEARRQRSKGLRVPSTTQRIEVECNICLKLLDILKNEKASQVDLGNFDSVMVGTTCKLHPRLLQSCLGMYFEWAKADALLTFKASSNSWGRVALEIYRDGPSDHLEGWCDFVYVLESACAVKNCLMNAVNPLWIDQTILFRWKQLCESQNHKDCGHDGATPCLPLVRPAWLIDTSRMCLVPGNNNAPYVALSYVWGQTPFFKTTKETLTDLQTDQALSTLPHKPLLPSTIADAFAVVKLLQERFLWVDALCIVQDDDELKQSQIDTMVYIYTHATVTIIAKEGSDAYNGLRGLKGISSPRRLFQQNFKLAKDYTLSRALYDDSIPHIWPQRGWTFQEEMFSRRSLVFDQGSVRWDCACSSFGESFVPRPGTRVGCKDHGIGHKTAINALSTQFPDLGMYINIVVGYSNREFTHAKDALAAFSGITTVLSRTFKNGFICGLPALFLDLALCWSARTGCQRRVPTGNLSLGYNSLPSWSWIGWRGVIDDWGIDDASSPYTPSPDGYRPVSEKEKYRRTIPIVRWSSRQWGKNLSTAIEAPWEYQALKDLAFQGTSELPTGWSRSDIEKEAGGPLGHRGIKWYKHESDPTTLFEHPIPLCQGDHEPPKWNSNVLLCCRTQRTWLHLEEKHIPSITDWIRSVPSLSFHLRDENGAWVGVLMLHEYLNEDVTQTWSFETSRTCELVAISRGFTYENDTKSVSSQLYERNHHERPKAFGTEAMYEFYNVLWVEWEDGVAYRKAYGRVEKGAWEAQKLEWIDLVLG